MALLGNLKVWRHLQKHERELSSQPQEQKCPWINTGQVVWLPSTVLSSWGQLSSSACFKINQNFQLWQVAAITETASVYTVFARCQACYLHEYIQSSQQCWSGLLIFLLSTLKRKLAQDHTDGKGRTGMQMQVVWLQHCVHTRAIHSWPISPVPKVRGSQIMTNPALFVYSLCTVFVFLMLFLNRRKYNILWHVKLHYM